MLTQEAPTKTHLPNQEVMKAIYVEATPLLATVMIRKNRLSHPITEEHILHALNHQGIVYGIKHSQIKNIIGQKLFDRPVPVAFHTPPVEAVPGYLDEKVEISPSSKPVELGDGTIDYKNINTFVTIEEGQIVAEIHEPIPGRNGVNIYGHPIFPQSVKDWHYEVGENIVLDSEQQQLVAQKSGIIYKKKDTIHIETKLVIKGSVNYSTGNVKFDGDIIIYGDVMPGFAVEAEKNIYIRGNVENALVTSSRGNVTVEGGIVGKRTSFIRAHQDLRVGYALESELYAGRNLYFNQYLLNCNSEAKGSIESKHNNSFIAGGTAIAQEKISISQLGNKSETKTNIKLFSSLEDDLMHDLSEQKFHLNRLEDLQGEVTKKILSSKDALAKVPEKKAEIKQTLIVALNEYKSLTIQINEANAAIEEIKLELDEENKRLRTFVVKKRIYANTVLNYGFSKKAFQTSNRGIEVKVRGSHTKTQEL